MIMLWITVVLQVVISLSIIFLVQHCYWVYYGWRKSKLSCGKKAIKLPPGSSGFPFIGESLELLIPTCSSLDIHPFIKTRIKRHGPLFRTNVGGHDVIVSADPDLSYFLFQQENKLVERSYLDLINNVFNIENFNGIEVHKYLRNVALSQFGIHSIREKLLSQFEDLVRTVLHSWSLRPDSVEFVSASRLEIFSEFGVKQLCKDLKNSRSELVNRMVNFSTSVMSFPLNIPGTSYHKCIKDKDRALQMIREMVKAAKMRSRQSLDDQDDLLSILILTKDMDSTENNFVTEELITEVLFGMAFAVTDTIPSVLGFAIKFISEDPTILHQLTSEHEEILKKRETPDSFVTWDEFKSMTFTLQVINETLRLVNVAPGFLRKVIKDIHVNGYTIPAGWKIMISNAAVHLNPQVYKDPLKFDPSRWKGVTSEFMRKNLIPFGGGTHQCAGADYVRVSLCIILHVLVSKYRWSVIKGGVFIQNPILHFKNGLDVSVRAKADIN